MKPLDLLLKSGAGSRKVFVGIRAVGIRKPERCSKIM